KLFERYRRRIHRFILHPHWRWAGDGQRRGYDITDPRWLRAMTAISESVQVVCSTSYIRVYERIGDTDKYQPITLDVAGVP
ncbi:DUF3164 family protein, partial [Yersinia pseudotuberculosis]